MKYRIRDYPEIAERVKNMSTDALIKTLMCPDCADDKPYIYRDTGAVFFHPNTDKVLHERITAVNQNRETPAMVVTDVENGAGFLEHGTVFPPLRACAETGDPSLAYEMGKTSAIETRPFGFQWGFGPCVDILGNVDNPITLNRSAGGDPDKVIAYAGAMIDGMQDNGLIATAKHFPGDGYAIYDQHLTTSVNPLSKEQWMGSFGKVYKALIERGVKTIMPGHIALPCMDDVDPETGAYRPASLSKKLLTGLLKQELGFEGIIVSDGTTMAGFCGYMNFYRACAQFWEAGGDVTIFAHPDKRFMSEMHRLIDEGVLHRETLEDRAYRFLCFAKEHETKLKPVPYSAEDHQRIADLITEKGMVVERDRYGILPFKKKKQLNILYNLISWREAEQVDNDIVCELKKHAANLDFVADIGPEATLKMIKENDYDLVVCRVKPVTGYGTNSGRLCGPLARNMMAGWQKMGTPVVFITDSNSLSSEYEVVIDTIINTHGYARRTAEFVVKRIFGE